VNAPAHQRPPRPLPQDRPEAPRPTLWRRIVETKAVIWISATYVRFTIAFARALGRRRATALSAWFTRLVAPLIPENRLAAASLASAFPEKSDAERRRILRGVWDNVARTAMEYAFLDEILAEFRLHRLDRGPFTATGIEDFLRIREDDKPALIFSAHLANWELPAIIAERFRLNLTIMYRMPKNSIVAADLMKVRNEMMGDLVPTRFISALEIADTVAHGGHVALLVDQRRTGSPPLPFFGRPAPTNTFFAKLARQYDCPVHGVRAIRLPGDRFHVELTPPIDLPRDAEGLIDEIAATQKINDIIEGWIREHPEQWLWLHDRWRMNHDVKQ
jgi:KDO2-lipid IV(A) lauroyltransferase